MAEELETQAQEEEGQGISLPFDIRTILTGLWRRRYIFVLIVVVFSVASIIGGLVLGTQTYESSTVLLYKPAPEGDESDSYTPSLFTLLSMVKMASNIEETRKRLHLAASVGQIGAACSVDIQRRTTLMSIRVKWGNGPGAAAIANTLRDVFLDNQRRIRQRKAENDVQDLSERLKTVKKQVKKAENVLGAFMLTNRIVDLDKEAQWYLEQLITMDTLYERTLADRNTINIQAKNIGIIISNLKIRVAEEMQRNKAQMQSLTLTNLRIQRLRELIKDDKTGRENMALLTKHKLELDRMKHLIEIGAVSSAQYHRVLAEYQKQEARTVDTEQIQQWKEEIKKLDEVVAPADAGSSPTGNLLENMMMREFEIQLDQIALGEKVKTLAASVEKVKKKLDTLPVFQRQYIALERDVALLESEVKQVEELLAAARRVQESGTTGFNLVSEAKVPRFPRKSTRKKIVVAIAGFGVFLAFLVIAGLELLDMTIKSGGELGARFSFPVLGALHKAHPGDDVFPGPGESVFIEDFRKSARKLRLAVPKRGARLLVVGACHGEGVTTVATNLAACFGRQDERVLVIDTQVRPDERQKKSETHDDLRALLAEPDGAVKGLGEYLSYEALDLDEIVWPTIVPGVECIPRVGKAVIPDLINTHRMREMLDELSSRFSLIFLDAPPIEDYVDTEALAQYADGIIFVVKSKNCSYFKLRKTLDLLEATGKPIVGTFLVGVEPLYMEG